MRREPEFFGDREMSLVYVGRRLKDSLRLEEALTAAGIDYAVETDRYWSGRLFRRERVGAFFYVLPEIEASTRALIEQTGLRPLEPDEARQAREERP